MTRFAVVLSPRAQSQLATIHDWWRENRPIAPTLFIDEFDALVAELLAGDFRGAKYAVDPAARRVLLARCRYHVYYDVNEARGVVEIVAIWHASRGRRPILH